MSEEMKKAELIASEKLNSKLLDSEKKYLEEKERLNKEEAESESAIRRRTYIEKLATATNNLAVSKAYRNENLRLQKEANDLYLAELKEAAEREREIYEQLKDDIKDTYDEILSYADQSIIETEKKRLKMEEKLSDYGRMTKKIIFHGAAPDGGDEIYPDLVDPSKLTEILKDYAKNLTDVKNRMAEGGISSEYINSLTQAVSELSVDKGLEFTKELNSKKDGDFYAYIDKWIEKENLTKAISAQIYESEMQESVKSTVDFMTKELEKLGLNVPEGFFLSGSISAEKFGDGFVAELSKQLAQIQSVIDSFNFSLNIGGTGGKEASTHNTSVYSPTYQINSGGTNDALLSSIKALEQRKVLSGIV